MKVFNRLVIVVLLIIALIFAAANFILRQDGVHNGRQYRVDVSRAAAVIESLGPESLNLSDYETLRGVYPVENEEDLLGGDYDYLIRRIDGQLYRFDYSAQTDRDSVLITVNVILGVISLLIVIVLIYIQVKILKPFSNMMDVPVALSKGNLAMPLQENRHGFFERFVWGMNMLRDSMEEQKERELSLQAEKKKLILSISHDIKIPLSAIKLYSKALEKNIYEDDRRAEIAVKINEKADEITGFVSKIVQASSEDFLALTVENQEFYISSLLEKIRIYYSEKLELLHTDFHMDNYTDCLLTGDPDRALEVIQNIIENAIKYGDGTSIDVRITSEENCRLISVENSGCTLSQDEIPHIFDSFWRGSNASKNEGSGLGLYICRTLMLKMGGEIFAECSNGKMCVTAVFYCA